MSVQLARRALFSRATTVTAACILMAGLVSGCATLGGGSSNPLVGTWKLTVESPLGTSHQTLVVGSDLAGAVTLDDTGDSMEISNATVEDNAVTFDITFDIQGQELPARFEGAIDGDTIAGDYVTDFGNGTVTGTRAP